MRKLYEYLHRQKALAIDRGIPRVEVAGLPSVDVTLPSVDEVLDEGAREV